MKYLAFLMLAASIMAFRPAPNATGKIYVSFKGSKQGQFKGQNSKGGRESEGWFEVMSFNFGVKAPNDNKTGASGREHNPVIIKKQTDAASPLLLESLNTKETLEVVIRTLDNSNKVIKTVILKGALVTGIHKDDWENVYFEYTDIVTQP